MKAIVIAGPTSVGKTDLSLYLAEKLKNVEIVSCDSMQIYKDMDIGTDKVSKDIRKKFPHYMIDIITPREKLALGEFVKKAYTHIQDIFSRGKIPIIVGGTTLYMHFLIYNLPIFTKKDNTLIKYLENLNNEELFEIIKKHFPEISKKISKNDRKRLLRYSELALKGENLNLNFWDNLEKRFSFVGIFLNRKKENIFKNIEKRVDKQIERGLIKEVKNIIKKYYFQETLDKFFFENKKKDFKEIYKNFQKYFDDFPALQGHSYKEIIFYLYNVLSLDEAKAWIVKSTKNYARRQIRWLKKYLDKDKVWKMYDIESISFEDIFKDVKNEI